MRFMPSKRMALPRPTRPNSGPITSTHYYRCLQSLVHLCISRPAAALANIPQFSELLACVMMFRIKNFPRPPYTFQRQHWQQHGPCMSECSIA